MGKQSFVAHRWRNLHAHYVLSHNVITSPLVACDGFTVRAVHETSLPLVREP